MSKKIYSVKTADLAGLDLELATETHDGKKVFKLKSGTLPESIKKIELVTPTVPIERKQTRSLFGIGSAKPPETGSIPAVTAVISDDQILAASKESTEVQIERIKTKIQAYSCTPVEGKSSPTLAPCKKDSLTDDLINYVGTNMLGTGLVFDSYSISSEEIVGEVSVSKENNLFWLHKVLILEPKFLGTTTIKLDVNSSKAMTATEQQDVRTNLQEIKDLSSSFKNINYVVNANGGNISGKYNAVGFRGFGLNLGFKF